ncbi:hypothetical protein HaLaN_18399, partial [Haematococcus lacustris]
MARVAASEAKDACALVRLLSEKRVGRAGCPTCCPRSTIVCRTAASRPHALKAVGSAAGESHKKK